MGKYIFCFLLIIFCFLQISCKDEITDYTGDPPRSVSMEVNGTLPHWNYGEGYYVMAVANVSSSNKTLKIGLDTAAINSFGAFNLVLHVLNEAYYTEPLSASEPNCNINIDPSPYFMKTVSTRFEIYKGNTYKGSIIDKAYHIGNDSVGSYFITYGAFSSDGTISGFKSCVNNDTTYSYYYVYDLAVKKDWTKIVSIVTIIEYGKTSYSITANDPQFNAVWEYSMNK
ncbi:MAG: hypothetical protein PHN88_11035 [Ignavibacteria bacterium]|nr:hypothetical protein [Ignavibacteria bacterium]